MDVRKTQPRKEIEKFPKTPRSNEDKPSLRSQVTRQRNGARNHSDSDETQRSGKIEESIKESVPKSNKIQRRKKEAVKENGSKKDKPSSHLQVKKQRPSARRPHGSTLPSSKQGVGVNPLDLRRNDQKRHDEMIDLLHASARHQSILPSSNQTGGMNPLDLPRSGRELEGMTVLDQFLPTDMKNEVNTFASKAHEARNAEYIKKFGSDWDTAREFGKILDQNTRLKNAVSQLPAMIKPLLGTPVSESIYIFALKAMAAKISKIPDGSTEFEKQIEAKIGAIVLATNPDDRDKAANDLWHLLSAVGIKMY